MAGSRTSWASVTGRRGGRLHGHPELPGVEERRQDQLVRLRVDVELLDLVQTVVGSDREQGRRGQ